MRRHRYLSRGRTPSAYHRLDNSTSIPYPDPSGEIAPAPEALGVTKPRVPEQLPAPTGRHRHLHARQHQAFALDLLGGILIRCFQGVVAFHEQIVEYSRRTMDRKSIAAGESM